MMLDDLPRNGDVDEQMAKMKILMILSKPFKTDPRVYKEAKSLVGAGHEVTVIVWDRKNNYPEQETVENINLVGIHNKGLIKLLPKHLFPTLMWWRAAYKKGLELYKNGFRFDVVHCHDLDTLQVGVWLKKKLGIKLVYDAHEIYGYAISGESPKFMVKAAFWMEKRLIKCVDHIITVSKPLEHYLKSITKKPITIVMNCKDLISKEYIPPKNDVFTLCYMGSLQKNRMFPEIVDVIGNVAGVKFVIAGIKNDLYEEVKERCKNYENVEFLGTIPLREVIPKTLESDAIICMFDPTNKNNQIGLPNKLFEGMVTGRPVIMTNGLYSSKIIEKEKCGVAIDYDKEEVKKAIEMLRDNPKLCEELGRNGLRAALREYNWKNQEEKLLKVYEDLKNENFNNSRNKT